MECSCPDGNSISDTPSCDHARPSAGDMTTRMAMREMHKLPYHYRSNNSRQARPIDEIYTPLETGEIRLLGVQDHNVEGLLQCSLKATQLLPRFSQHTPTDWGKSTRELPESACEINEASGQGDRSPEQAVDGYTAVSYTWNVKDRVWYGKYDLSPKLISINNVLVEVSDKVANVIALMHINGHDRLWIDAICINQKDLSEKSQQVSIMGDIYATASTVLSVIGTPSNHTDYAFDAMNDHISNPDRPYDRPTKAFRGWLAIVAKDYWRRAWILQEVSLAQEVILCCGSKSLPLTSLQPELLHMKTPGVAACMKRPRHIIDYVRFGLTLIILGLSRVKHWDYLDGSFIYSGFLSNAPLMDLLGNGQSFSECTDPRDLLYSRLSLATDGAVLVPPPSYDSRVEDIYKLFARNCIMLGGSLDLVTLAHQSKLKLPSWVPDWTYKYQSIKSRWYTHLDPTRYTWEEKGLPQVTEDGSELRVQGRCIYTVGVGSVLKACAGSWGSAKKSNSATFFFYHLLTPPRIGDELCVLRNCSYPVYLRKNGQHYAMVKRRNIFSCGRHDAGSQKDRGHRYQDKPIIEYYWRNGYEVTTHLDIGILHPVEINALPEQVFVIQ